jgi:diketogulonate reductase-like aldo/keto reductase
MSNLQVFGWEISSEDMKKMDALECYGVTGKIVFCHGLI